MSDLLGQIATLSAEKRELFEALLSESGGEFNAFPLSFAQQRLWFLDQFQPNSALYNIPAAVRIEGALDVAVLEKSINAIVRRHEALRTTFVAVGGYPVQVIAPALTIECPIVALDLVEGEGQVQRLVKEVAQQAFELSSGPLLRARLLRLSDAEHVLILIWHHIIADGWSLGVFMRELAALYDAFVNRKEALLPNLPIQYADFAVWQRQWLRGEVLEEQLAYWREQLGGKLPPLELPTDRPRPAIQTFQGACQAVVLSRSLTAALHALSQRQGVTLFVTLLAAFQTLLHRYTGQDDVLVGSPIANRSEGETEGLIGFFVNTLVLRIDLSGDPTFLELLQRVQQVAWGAYAHQDLPFEKLVEELQPARNMSHAPLFQVMFSLQNAPMPAIELSDLSLTLVDVHSGTAKFDLTLDLTETAQVLRGWLEYNTDLFAAETIARMAGHLRTLLEGIVADPDQRLANLPFLTGAERHQLLVEWSAPRNSYPEDRCIHQLFEAQVTQTPDAIALLFENQQLTYQQLNARSNQLARYLRRLGAGPEVIVGLCCETSIEAIIGLQGILKAGAAYMPLDPAHPQERLAFMLKDARVQVSLTQERLAERVTGHGIEIVCLDSEWEAIAKENEEDLSTGVTASNLAYVIYTSGSTGEPKGVQVTHYNVVRLFQATWDWYHFSAQDVWTLFHSYAFDFSVWEIWGPLLYGGRLVVVPYWVRRSSEAMYALLIKEQITVLNQTPSAFQQLVSVEDAMDVLPSLALRLVIFGGEALNYQSLRSWFDRHGDLRPQLVNMYGITETTVHVTYRPVARQDIAARAGSLIGVFIPDLPVYLLDAHQQLVPIGVPGEICVGGAGVARGYLDRPQLTAQRFTPNPFKSSLPKRLYRSGDLARYTSDGDLEYLGRIDQQVKIRGFRIELGEIEAVLAQYSAVQEAVVLAHEDMPGGKGLVAYIVPQKNCEAIIGELRYFLKEKLPEYMMPAAFVVLEALPLTPNGKVDRRALPVPDLFRPEGIEDFVAPRTPVEEVLTGIWSDVLGIEKVGISDNFFELGGHSLLATQLISRLREIFQVELPLRTLFEVPTVAGLAERIEIACQTVSRQPRPPFRSVPREGALPLSFAQQRLWFLDRLEGQTAVYNLSGAVHLAGRLNVLALKQSLNGVVRRQESLRTLFTENDGRPLQVVLPSFCLALPMVDLHELSATEREVEVQRLATAEARCPFDLRQGPLVRATLLCLAEENFILLLSMHHIIADGWSMGVLIREVMVFYNAFVSNEAALLPDLPIQYADFAVWQREWLQGQVLAEQLNYWRGQLGDNVFPLELPADRPRPPFQTFHGAHYPVKLSKSLTTVLHALSRQGGVTLFMTLLAAFKTLLHRYTGQDDVFVGSPIANRTETQTESLIGFFVNTLVLRTALSGDPTFGTLLQRVRQVALGAYAHQDLPFEKLVEELQPERDMSRAPLFQVMFTLQNAPGSTLELPGLSLALMVVDNRTAKFDLTLDLTETPDGMQGWFEYNTELFEGTTIARMAGHLQTLLKGIAVDPGQHLSNLPLLTDAECQQLLFLWNDTGAEYLQDQCFHELFEAHAKRAPDVVALVFKDQHLTYRALDRRASQLAHHLRALDVGPEVCVGICTERSLEMLIGLYGILKAGGVYVPLDPTYPRRRLAFMMADSWVSVLLTQERLISALPMDETPSNPERVCLDTDWQTIAQYKEQSPVNEVVASNLVYVIYTSGSTGTPKGAMNTHGGIRNRLLWMQEAYQLGAADRVMQKTPFSFDVSVWEFFWPLTVGACLVIARPEGHRDSEYLVSLVVEQCITTMHFVPSMLQAFVEEQRMEKCCSLKRIICSGEALPFDLQARFYTRSGATLHNLYGPTEAAVDVTFWTCERHAKRPVVPIGRPIANTQIHLLDACLHPVPVGISGELHIGGIGLARGYWQRPELTAERFVPDSSNNQPGARLYKTGDLARYLPDGNIEFLGRIDHQIKIRGLRIELGEIETVLVQYPSVREAVVLAREDLPGDKRLAAYVVPHRESLMIDELRGFLKEKLPDYMVPSAFTVLEALPLLPNGKIDRRALPAPDTTRSDQADTLVAPRTPVEEVLAALWAQVLNVERVGVHDNFFERGGHSLLATQLNSQIRRVFQLELSLRSLFEAPTVASLAERLEAVLRTERGFQSLPLRPASRGGDLPLSFAQERLWFLDQWESGSSVYNISTAIHLSGPLDVDAFRHSLNEIVRRHEALRTTFIATNGQPVQVIASDSSFLLPVVDLADLVQSEHQTEVQWLTNEEGQHPFDLVYGPLVRATLLRLSEKEYILLLTMHHIISDGWSLGVLVQELVTLYEAFVTGQRSPLPELPIQYADYAIWQREWLQGEVLEAQLAYWKRQLGVEPVALDLPTDRPRPPIQTFRGMTQTLALSQSLTRALYTFSRQEGVTLFMTLLAAFKVLLCRYTGQEDITVGSPIAGRTWAETERLIGLFLNTLVLRTDLSGNLTFRDVLGRVREVALGAYTHQDVPFEKLLEELQPERDLSRTPLFQVFINMLNFPHDEIALPGLKVKWLSPPEIGSKFDLTLYIHEQAKALQLMLVYNTSLFERARIVEILEQLKYLLTQIVENPEERIADLSLVTPRAKAYLPDPTQLLGVVWYGAVHEAFSHQIQRLPLQLAVIDKQETWTYQELEAWSNQLAHYLQASGIQPQDVVAIYAHRSASLVWAVLGVLKAGAAFLILDPTYPSSRLIDCLCLAKPRGWLQIKEAGEPPAALTEFVTTLACRCRLTLPQRTIAAAQGLLMDYSTDNTGITTDPEDLAYVAFTSGSTGVPKGILGTHRPLSHFVRWQSKTFGLRVSDRFSMLSGLAHDPLLRDIFVPLSLGATLCVPDPEKVGNSGWLIDWMREQQITVTHLTPSMGQLLIETANTTCPSLRYAFFGGDTLSRHLVSKLCALAPAITCVNFYGTTETPQAKGYFIVPNAGDDNCLGEDHALVPLGRGIENVQLLVLTASQKLAGIGERGEIYVRSPYLAEGYLGDEALTRERFVVNPLTKGIKDRLYKTGDWGHYLPDGHVAFLGRADHQVKIRGFRIEPGEIEVKLREHAAVRRVAIIAREDVPGDKHLVAYIVSDQKIALDANELRSFLKGRLPNYMIPSTFVQLESIPLTPSGKVDRRALPAPKQRQSENVAIFVAPRTLVEESLASIWATVLNVEKVGIYDNFFQLGGHSLLAVRIISQIYQTFQVEISLLNFFEGPTVANLALAIEQQQQQPLDNQIDVLRSEQVEAIQVLENLNALSDEEVDALLDNLLSAQGGSE